MKECDCMSRNLYGIIENSDLTMRSRIDLKKEIKSNKITDENALLIRIDQKKEEEFKQSEEKLNDEKRISSNSISKKSELKHKIEEGDYVPSTKELYSYVINSNTSQRFKDKMKKEISSTYDYESIIKKVKEEEYKQKLIIKVNSSNINFSTKREYIKKINHEEIFGMELEKELIEEEKRIKVENEEEFRKRKEIRKLKSYTIEKINNSQHIIYKSDIIEKINQGEIKTKEEVDNEINKQIRKMQSIEEVDEEINKQIRKIKTKKEVDKEINELINEIKSKEDVRIEKNKFLKDINEKIEQGEIKTKEEVDNEINKFRIYIFAKILKEIHKIELINYFEENYCKGPPIGIDNKFKKPLDGKVYDIIISRIKNGTLQSEERVRREIVMLNLERSMVGGSGGKVNFKARWY